MCYAAKSPPPPPFFATPPNFVSLPRIEKVLLKLRPSGNFAKKPRILQKSLVFCKALAAPRQVSGRGGGGHAWPRVPAPGTRGWGPRRRAAAWGDVSRAGRQLVFIAPGGWSCPWAAVGCRETARRRATGVCFAYPVSSVLGDGCRGSCPSKDPPQILQRA